MIFAATFKCRNHAWTEETKQLELETRLVSILGQLVREIHSWSEARSEKNSTRSSGLSALKWRRLLCCHTTVWSSAESVIIPTLTRTRCGSHMLLQQLLRTLGSCYSMPARTHDVNHDRYPALVMGQGEASEKLVPAPSSTQQIENVPHVAELDVPDLQDLQNPDSFSEPSGTVRTLSNLPQSLYDRCQSWMERSSTPFLHVINTSIPPDRLLYEIQSSLASRFISMTRDEGLPLLVFRCSRSVNVPLDFMLQALCRQLHFHLSRGATAMRNPVSQNPTKLGTFEASLACITQNVSGVFLNPQNIRTSGDQIRRFQNILDSHCAHFPLSKFLFLTRGFDDRFTIDDKDLHLLRDRKCSQPLGDLRYS